MKKILIFALCCMTFMTLNAQDGWEKIINNGELQNRAVDFWEAPDGSFIVAYNLIEQIDGSEEFENVEIHLAHLDQDGTLISDNIIPNGSWLGRNVYDIQPLPNGNLLIAGINIESISIPGETFTMEVTIQGQIVWEKNYDINTATRIIAATDGSFFLFGNSYDEDFTNVTTYMMGISEIGDSLWVTEPIEYEENTYFIDAQMSNDGTMYVFSKVAVPYPEISEYQLVVTKVDELGALISEIFISPEVSESILYQSDFTTLPSGGFIMSASQRFADILQPEYERFMVYKYNNNIELEWKTEIDSIPIADFGALTHIGHGDQQISLDDDGNISAVFSTQRRFTNNTPADYSRRYFAKLDQTGAILSSNMIELAEHREYPAAFEQTSTGGYFFCGWYRSGIPSSWSNTDWSFGVRLDENGNSITNEINGNLYWDENLDCENQDEQGFEGWIIEAQNSALTYYDVTDADGNYSINIGTGSYDLKAIPPTEYWDICEGTVPVTFTETYDTLTQDFSAQALLDCPAMWVDISTWGLGNCFESTYTVNYCNNGTIDEAEAYIEVLIPEGLDIIEADLPYTILANGLLRFDIGAVAVNECGSFQFEVYVDCETVVEGQTMCTEAHIYPDTLCMPGLLWTGASIQVTGECDAENITYTIKNIGDAPTSQALEYFVVEDQVILMYGNFDLNPGEEELVQLPVTGATYRLEAEQEPNHPGFSMPSLAIEGCGGLTAGQVNLFSTDDNDDFIDIDCREVLASYDPNDKTGYPLGYTDENFIEESTQLEYVIRFQNTGTFTARRVVLRDTLSQFLDPTTVVPGSSSHPYTFEMIGNGVLKFTFDEIMLPDSATNEAASQGFVKFKISQRADNEIGTVIHNSAAIYFDFNEPIITNETMHTVGEAFFTSIEYLTEDNDVIQALVYPNPFASTATIEIKDYAFTRGQFELYDITGRTVHKQQVDKPTFIFERNNLPAGTYAFNISLDGKKVILGKLVVL